MFAGSAIGVPLYGVLAAYAPSGAANANATSALKLPLMGNLRTFIFIASAPFPLRLGCIERPRGLMQEPCQRQNSQLINRLVFPRRLNRYDGVGRRRHRVAFLAQAAV